MNYRAVCRARTPKEFIAKLSIVVEEADESQGWLETLVTRSLGGEPARELLQEATELVAIFTASKHTWIRNHPEFAASATTSKRRRRD